MQIIIERGVPLPGRRRGRPASPIGAALRQMRPGDSVVLPLTQPFAMAYAAPLKKLGMRFTSRKIDATSCRVWRLEDQA